MRVGTLSISTSRFGTVEPASDPATDALVTFAKSLGGDVVLSDLVRDDRREIAERLTTWADHGQVDLILTCGGTGLAESDVTPEATLDVIDREAQGIAEALRLASKPHTKYWMMSRGVAGLRGRVLIINFPGNPKAVAEAGAPLIDTLSHAMALLLDENQH